MRVILAQGGHANLLCIVPNSTDAQPVGLVTCDEHRPMVRKQRAQKEALAMWILVYLVVCGYSS